MVRRPVVLALRCPGRSQHGQQPGRVMGTQDVQTAVKGRRRIVLPDLLHVPAEVRRIATPQPRQRSRAEGIIHESVGLPAQQIPPPMGVGDLVAAVLPHLTQQEAVRFLRLHGLSNFSDEVIGQLVRHIQSPAVGPLPQPVPHHGVLTPHDEVPIGGRLLVHRRQSPYAPPRIVVRGPRMEAVPVEIERILTLGRPQLRVEAFGVEVAADAAGVVEHTVQNDGNAQLLGRLAQLSKVLLGAQDRVDLGVVGRVVAVVARGFKDGVEVDGCKAQLGDTRQVFLDSLERSAVEVPGLDGAVLGALVYGRLVPVLDHAALDSVARLFDLSQRALAPVLVAGVAIGENLVDHAALVPLGTNFAVFVDGDLERRHLGIVVGHAFAAGTSLRCAQANLGLALDIAYKAVPDKTGLSALKLYGKYAVALVRHGIPRLTDLIDPGAQRKRCLVGVGILQNHR